MVEINLANQRITDEFEANSAISEGDSVAVTGANLVDPADDTLVQSAIGLANAAANSGEVFEVVVIGRKQATADGTINPGEPVIPATTAGRVVSEVSQDTSHQHTAWSTDGTDSAPAAHQSVVDGDGTASALVAGVDSSGQAAEDVLTDSINSSPQNGRSLGMAVSAAAAAGDPVTVLVGYKMG